MTTRRVIFCCLAVVLHASSAHAQFMQKTDVPESSAGQVGQRRQKNDNAIGTVPTRLESRIATRISSRIRNRIDRYYTPQAGAAASIDAAAGQVRRATQVPNR